MQTGNTNYIYKNDIDKACFQHDMAHGKYKDRLKEQNQRKFWNIKPLKLLVMQNMMDMKKDLLQWFTGFLIKIPLHLWINLLKVLLLNVKQQLADKLDKPIIRKF